MSQKKNHHLVIQQAPGWPMCQPIGQFHNQPIGQWPAQWIGHIKCLKAFCSSLHHNTLACFKQMPHHVELWSHLLVVVQISRFAHALRTKNATLIRDAVLTDVSVHAPQGTQDQLVSGKLFLFLFSTPQLYLKQCEMYFSLKFDLSGSLPIRSHPPER